MANNSIGSGSSLILIPSEQKEDTRNMLVAAGVEPKEVVAHAFPTSVEWDFNDDHVARIIYEQTARSVVCIYKHIGWYDKATSKYFTNSHACGTGFIWKWNSQRFIVTNYHVIKEATHIRVFLYKSNIAYNVDVVSCDAVADIAVLRINSPKDDLIPIKNGVFAAVGIGDPVFAIGHTPSEKYQITRGVVSQILKDGDILSQITLDREGSGGPLLDKDGNLIGVNKYLVTDPVTGFPTGLAKAIPVDTLSAIFGMRYGLSRRLGNRAEEAGILAENCASNEAREHLSHSQWDFIDGRVVRIIYEQSVRSVVCITKHVSWVARPSRAICTNSHGLGIGFVWERISERYIVTNFHVIKEANDIRVFLYKSCTPYSADVVAYDDVADIAVLSIDAPKDDLIPIKIGVSASVGIGDPVFAIGHIVNTYKDPLQPGEMYQIITQGMVRQIGEDGDILSQITLNRESRGGPLLDKDGNLIGVNKSMVTDPVTGFLSGSVRTIPVDTVSRFLDGLFIGLPRA